MYAFELSTGQDTSSRTKNTSDSGRSDGSQRAETGHTSPLQNLTLVSLQKDQSQICGHLCQKAPAKEGRAHRKKPVKSLRGRVWKSWELCKYFWTQDLYTAGGDPALPCQTKQVFPAALLPHHILPNFPEGSDSLYSSKSAKAAPNNLLLSSYASNNYLWHYWCKLGKQELNVLFGLSDLISVAENLSSFSVTGVKIHDMDKHWVNCGTFPKIICSLAFLHPYCSLLDCPEREFLGQEYLCMLPQWYWKSHIFLSSFRQFFHFFLQLHCSGDWSMIKKKTIFNVKRTMWIQN